MIGKAFKYKSLNRTDEYQHELYQTSSYSYLLQEVNMDTTLRTEVTNKANFHGGFSSETLANPRLITMKGKVVGLTKELRHQAFALLVSKIQPEGNPNLLNRGFYPLEFQDDNGTDKMLFAKVYEAPSATNGLDDPIIEYEFTLLSESEKIYGSSDITVQGKRGVIGGMTLGATLPIATGEFAGIIEVMNSGNRIAPCRINLLGSAQNPKVYNITNGQKYRITGTTENFVLDNRNMNNNPKETIVVTDNGINIKEKRHSGADIFLDPGVNQIVLMWDNPYNSLLDVFGAVITDVNGDPIGYAGEGAEDVYITYRNTYIR